MPLDAARIRERWRPPLRERLRRAEVAWSLASTNSALLAGRSRRAGRAAGEFDFLAAEHQTAGRGRRARQWLAPPGGALCLSLGWSFAALPSGAAALSLAVGVCARRALASIGHVPMQLKWPNDLLVEDRKLGGILIELRAESAGPAYVVIGIGINCALGTALTRRVRDSGTEPIDLASLGRGALRSQPARRRAGQRDGRRACWNSSATAWPPSPPNGAPPTRSPAAWSR